MASAGRCIRFNGFRIQEQHHQNAKRLAELGLEISMTELDIRITLPSSQSIAAASTRLQRFSQFLPEDTKLQAVVLWGFTDGHSWIPGWFPGTGDATIYDRDYQPKHHMQRLTPRFGKT